MTVIAPAEISDSDKDFAEAILVEVVSFGVLHVAAAEVGLLSVLPLLVTLGALAVVVVVV
jgi:hypothetical protein